MADIEIMEVRAFEPRCLECGETGPIESSVFFAMAWEEAHECLAVRIDSEPDRVGERLVALLASGRLTTLSPCVRLAGLRFHTAAGM